MKTPFFINQKNIVDLNCVSGIKINDNGETEKEKWEGVIILYYSSGEDSTRYKFNDVDVMADVERRLTNVLNAAARRPFLGYPPLMPQPPYLGTPGYPPQPPQMPIYPGPQMPMYPGYSPFQPHPMAPSPVEPVYRSPSTVYSCGGGHPPTPIHPAMQPTTPPFPDQSTPEMLALLIQGKVALEPLGYWLTAVANEASRLIVTLKYAKPDALAGKKEKAKAIITWLIDRCFPDAPVYVDKAEEKA